MEGYVVTRPRPRLAAAARLTAWLPRMPLDVVAVVTLTVLAAGLRFQAMGAPLWIDEGLSIGIASHPFAEIPGLLAQDGSPPLYYLLLHLWMAGFGSTEHATHALSAVAAVASVPAAWWAGRALDRMSGVLAAALVAVCPFVGLYAVETRMYALVLLLGILATGAFLRAFVRGERHHASTFAVTLAAILYTHNWGFFFAAATAIAFVVLLAATPERRPLLVAGVVGFGGAAVLYAPWIPSLLDQVAHTGAPWSVKPSGTSIERSFSRMLGGRLPETILLLVAAGGFVEAVRRREGPALWRAGVATAIITAGTLLLAWGWSRYHDPAWALRYLVIVLAPLVVFAGIGLARLPILGVATVVVLFLVSWQGSPNVRSLEHKSDVARMAQRLDGRLPPGTLVFSPQPEQVANLSYYLPAGMRWLTPLGRVGDPGVMDWRDALHRLRVATYPDVLGHAVRRLHPGQRLLVVQPLFRHPSAPWTRQVRRIARRWMRRLRRGAPVRRVMAYVPTVGSTRSTVAAILFVRQRVGTGGSGSFSG